MNYELTFLLSIAFTFVRRFIFLISFDLCTACLVAFIKLNVGFEMSPPPPPATSAAAADDFGKNGVVSGAAAAMVGGGDGVYSPMCPIGTDQFVAAKCTYTVMLSCFFFLILLFLLAK
jgi:hypothetical protein